MTRTSVNVGSSDQHALAAILDHHAALRRELDDRVRALRTAVRTQATYEQPLAALVAFVEGSVLPHAAAEGATLYPAAARDAGAAYAHATLAVHGMEAVSAGGGG